MTIVKFIIRLVTKSSHAIIPEYPMPLFETIKVHRQSFVPEEPAGTTMPGQDGFYFSVGLCNEIPQKGFQFINDRKAEISFRKGV